MSFGFKTKWFTCLIMLPSVKLQMPMPMAVGPAVIHQMYALPPPPPVQVPVPYPVAIPIPYRVKKTTTTTTTEKNTEDENKYVAVPVPYPMPVPIYRPPPPQPYPGNPPAMFPPPVPYPMPHPLMRLPPLVVFPPQPCKLKKNSSEDCDQESQDSCLDSDSCDCSGGSNSPETSSSESDTETDSSASSSSGYSRYKSRKRKKVGHLLKRPRGRKNFRKAGNARFETFSESYGSDSENDISEVNIMARKASANKQNVKTLSNVALKPLPTTKQPKIKPIPKRLVNEVKNKEVVFHFPPDKKFGNLTLSFQIKTK